MLILQRGISSEEAQRSDELQTSSVFVQAYKSKSGARAYTKKLACYFCEKLLLQKMERHLESVHKDEPEVQLIEMKSKRERALGYENLLNRCNFNHNVRVIENGIGKFIVKRRPSRQL